MHRNPYPDFIGNQTAFKYLLAPDKGPLLYLARKGAADRSVYLRLVQLPKQEKCQVKLSIPTKVKSKKKVFPEFVDDDETEEISIKSESDTETVSQDEISEKSDVEVGEAENSSVNSNEKNESVHSSESDSVHSNENNVDNSSSTFFETTGFVLERVLSIYFDAGA